MIEQSTQTGKKNSSKSTDLFLIFWISVIPISEVRGELISYGKGDNAMTYKQIFAMPDGERKLAKLEIKLLSLQHHGADFFKGLEEFRRLYDLYHRS